MRSLTTTIGAMSLLLAGCVVGPIPEPPQVDLVADKVDSGDPRHRGDQLTGAPGAASPPGALVRVFPLDTDEPPVDGVVREDGSFTVDRALEPDEELRLVVIAEAGRSEPLDVLFDDASRQLRPAPRPLAGCLWLTPAAELDLAAGRSISVENGCDREVQLERPALRRAVDGLTVAGDRSWPAALAPGETITVELEVTEAFDQEEILFITASAPERDRRPVTLIPP